MIENTNTEFHKLIEEVKAIRTPSQAQAENIIQDIRRITKQYVRDNNIQALVMGISGGLDSSVVAALCQEKFIGVPLIGISIPMSSTNSHKEQAAWVGENYCTAFEEFSGWDEEWFDSGESEAYDCPTNMVSEVSNTIIETDSIAVRAGFTPDTFPKKILSGNIKARLRMITLYDLARKTNGMVLSTDNEQEFQMGFWTICGDVGDFGPIQNISKGFELPALAEALGIQKNIISQKPSDGLKVSDEDSDEAQLGANYQEVETIMSIYLENLPVSETIKKSMKSRLLNLINVDDTTGASKVAKIIKRYEDMTFKRNGTINITRSELNII